MDIDAKGKGKVNGKGMNKDTGKAQDNPDTEMTYYYCGKVPTAGLARSAEGEGGWTTHKEDWVMVDSQSTTRQSVRSLVVQPDSLSLILAARRRSDTPREMVPMFRSRSKLRRCDGHCSRWLVSFVEKEQVAVFTVDPAVRKLSMECSIGHFWLPLARSSETSLSLVMAPMEVRQGGRTSTRRWTRSCPLKSGLLEWCGSLTDPRQ